MASHVASGAAVTVVARGLDLISGLALTVFIARNLGIEALGLWVALVAALQTASTIGLGGTAIEDARQRVNRERSPIGILALPVRRRWQLTGIAVIVATIGSLLVEVAITRDSRTDALTAAWAVLVLISTQTRLVGEQLRADGRFILASLGNGTLGRMAALVAAIAFPGASLEFILWSWVVADGLFVLCASSSPGPQIPDRIPGPLSLQLWLQESVGVIGPTLILWLTLFLIGEAATGLLGIGLRLSGVLSIPVTAIGQTLARPVERSLRGASIELRESVRLPVRISFGAVLGVTAVLPFGGGELLAGVYGVAWADLQATTLILAFGALIQMGTGPCGLALLYASEERVVLRTGAWALAALVVTSIAFAPAMGAIGIALAYTLAFGGQNLGYDVRCRQVLGSSVGVFA